MLHEHRTDRLLLGRPPRVALVDDDGGVSGGVEDKVASVRRVLEDRAHFPALAFTCN